MCLLKLYTQYKGSLPYFETPVKLCFLLLMSRIWSLAFILNLSILEYKEFLWWPCWRYRTKTQTFCIKLVRSMSPGSLSFAKLVMMSSAPAKCAGVQDTRPKIHSFIQSTLSHTISVDSNLY